MASALSEPLPRTGAPGELPSSGPRLGTAWLGATAGGGWRAGGARRRGRGRRRPRGWAGVRLWERVVNRGLDRPAFRVEPCLSRHALGEVGWRALTVEAHHVFAVGQLPLLHRDPFDRLLLAQAHAAGLLLITADQLLPHSPGPARRTGHRPRADRRRRGVPPARPPLSVAVGPRPVFWGAPALP